MKKYKEIKVNITAKFGSPMQEEFFLNTLRLMIKSALSYSQYKHKDNDFRAIIDVDGKILSWDKNI